MDKRVLVVGGALLLVAAAFFVFPPGVEAPPPPVAAAAADGAPASPDTPAAEGTVAAPPVEELTPVDLGCGDLGRRIGALTTTEFARDVGTAAHAKFPGDDALIAECKRYMAADDATLMKIVQEELGLTAP